MSSDPHCTASSNAQSVVTFTYRMEAVQKGVTLSNGSVKEQFVTAQNIYRGIQSHEGIVWGYPIYQRGNPQLRVFLPNFCLKLVRPEIRQPPNVVQFACSMEMTKHDVKSYLQRIYGVSVAEVRTRIAMGRMRRDPGKGYVVKDDDVKYAWVKLPKGTTFEFPDIFDGKSEDQEESLKSLDEAKKGFRTYLERNKERPSLPSWFSL